MASLNGTTREVLERAKKSAEVRLEIAQNGCANATAEAAAWNVKAIKFGAAITEEKRIIHELGVTLGEIVYSDWNADAS